MANTPFLNLFKPTDLDQALVTDINSNMDKIDAGVSTLSDQIGNMGIYTMSSSQELLTVARDTNICPENTVRWINPRNGTVSGGATQYGIACVTKRINSAISVKVFADSGNVFSNGWNSSTGDWNGWQQMVTSSNIRVGVSSATDENGQATITFSPSFSSTPVVVATPLGTSNSSVFAVKVGSLSASSALLTLTQVSGGNVSPVSGNSIRWIAISL